MANKVGRPQNYYTNPAFSQQSEFYNTRRSPGRNLSSPAQSQQRESPARGLSPRRALSPARPLSPQRQPPVGAQSPRRLVENASRSYEEQDFYEEMLVDGEGYVKQQKLIVVPSSGSVPYQQQHRYAVISGDEDGEDDDGDGDCETNGNSRYQKNRYEYIPMNATPTSSPPKKMFQQQPQIHEEYNSETGRVHRYAVIPMEDETEFSTNNNQR